MHELGVAFYVVKDVKKIMAENDVKKVKSVTVEIGEVSTVVPELLVDVWNWAANKEPMLEDCEIKVEQIRAITFCEDCKQEYPTVPQGKICPYCNSENTFLKVGNEFNLKEIEVYDDDEDY